MARSRGNRKTASNQDKMAKNQHKKKLKVCTTITAGVKYLSGENRSKIGKPYKNSQLDCPSGAVVQNMVKHLTLEANNISTVWSKAFTSSVMRRLTAILLSAKKNIGKWLHHLCRLRHALNGLLTCGSVIPSVSGVTLLYLLRNHSSFNIYLYFTRCTK